MFFVRCFFGRSIVCDFSPEYSSPFLRIFLFSPFSYFFDIAASFFFFVKLFIGFLMILLF